MPDEPLRVLYHQLLADPSLNRTRDCTFSDAVVLLIHFFAVMTHHSPHWAIDQRNWPLWCRRLDFPSYSQLMKRLKRPAIIAAIQRIDLAQRQQLPSTAERVVDGKPLVVGGYSKDPDVKHGKVPGGWAWGYRLHAMFDSAGQIHAFDVTAMDKGEPTVLRKLIDELKPDLTGITIRGDSAYDSNAFYGSIERCGGRLIAPRKKPGTQLGHHPQHRHRLAAIAELENDPERSVQHKHLRRRAEQRLAHLTNLPEGLWALPNHVRRLHRVKLWVQSKILLYHLHLLRTQTSAQAAA
jgi:hypothetical protein